MIVAFEDALILACKDESSGPYQGGVPGSVYSATKTYRKIPNDHIVRSNSKNNRVESQGESQQILKFWCPEVSPPQFRLQ